MFNFCFSFVSSRNLLIGHWMNNKVRAMAARMKERAGRQREGNVVYELITMRVGGREK